jgi:hypothetical protein
MRRTTPLGNGVIREEWDFEVHRKYVFTANSSKCGRALITPKAKIREAGSLEAERHNHYDTAVMWVTVRYPKPHRDRDAANLYPTMKAYIDGLTHPDLNDRHNPNDGILPDDNDHHFTGPFIVWSGEQHQGDTYVFHIRLEGERD